MSFKNWSVYVAMLVGIALVSSARGEEPESLWQPYEEDAAETEADEQSVIVEDAWIAPQDPQEHMTESRANFVKKDAEGTARELRSAAKIVREEAEDATGKSKTMLETSASELDQLANDITSGTIESVESLDHAFARAQYALAIQYHDVATKSMSPSGLRRAGHALAQSVKAFEYAVEWSGEKLESGVKLTIDSALLLSGKLIEGTGYVAKEAGEIVAAFGNEIEKFGKVIDPYSNN